MIKKLNVFFVFLAAFALAPPVLCAKKLTIGVGVFEPFFVKEDESGVFLELIKETFKQMPGYETEFSFMSNERTVRDLNAGWIDGAANVFKGSKVDACLSDPVFRYSDVAVSLKKKGFAINRIADLGDKRIAAYQNATLLLGKEFAEMATSNPEYREYPEPFVTTNLLVKDRVDVRIGDIFIFLYDINRPLHKGKVGAEQFTVHRLFPDVYTHMAFRDKNICEKFDRALEEIKANGTFDAVYKKHEEHLRGIGQPIPADNEQQTTDK